jgi:hypothetical protein
MIDVTPDILGPGIDEEYADALDAIRDIRAALGKHRLTNDTPEGRLLLNVAWVEQEILARRLPIPVHRSFVETIFHLVGSNELGGVAGFQPALSRLWLVLKGYGLIKPRHFPVLLAMIGEFLADAGRCSGHDEDALHLLGRLREYGDFLAREGQLPPRLPPEKQFAAFSDVLKSCPERAFSRLDSIDASLFEAWRPKAARKPALAAPVPGLPAEAPLMPPDAKS